MSESLLISRRFDDEIFDPSDRDQEDALRQVFIENEPQLNGATQEKLRGAFLRFGTVEGLLFVVYVYRLGHVKLEQWADAECERELAGALHLHRVIFDDALRLCRLARDRNIAGLR